MKVVFQRFFDLSVQFKGFGSFCHDYVCRSRLSRATFFDVAYGAAESNIPLFTFSVPFLYKEFLNSDFGQLLVQFRGENIAAFRVSVS